jgi:CubicO group peptidase (beta-lactamase class C family)
MALSGDPGMKTVRSSLVFAGLILASFAAQGQTLSSDMAAKVDKVFEKWNRTDSPGCAVGVYKDGQTVYEHGYGMANLNDDVPITPETLFHVASISKQFTAASILLLAQQGKLSLDDDVHKYIPELPDFGEHITLRHMMHHTRNFSAESNLSQRQGCQRRDNRCERFAVPGRLKAEAFLASQLRDLGPLNLRVIASEFTSPSILPISLACVKILLLPSPP